MNYARAVNGVIQEVITFNPEERFAPDVAAMFFAVAHSVEVGAVSVAGVWVNPAPAEPIAPSTVYLVLSPIQFKLCFTSAERIAIQAARATDPIIDDFYDILDDARLTEVDLGLSSTQNGVGYLALQGLIAPERVAEILAGTIV